MNPILTSPVLALAVIGLSLTSCGSGQERSTATAKASASVPSEADKAVHSLDATQEGLKRIRDSADHDDLKKLYGDVKADSSRLSDDLDDVASRSDAAIASGKNQIEQWHKQADSFADADLRNASNVRQGNLRQAVDALSASRATFTAASGSYRSQLADSLKALDLDLTHAGVQTVSPVLGKLIDDEAHLRASLADLSEKSRAVNALLSPN